MGSTQGMRLKICRIHYCSRLLFCSKHTQNNTTSAGNMMIMHAQCQANEIEVDRSVNSVIFLFCFINQNTRLLVKWAFGFPVIHTTMYCIYKSKQKQPNNQKDEKITSHIVKYMSFHSSFCLVSPSLSELLLPLSLIPVSYTHLTLPTNRLV